MRLLAVAHLLVVALLVVGPLPTDTDAIAAARDAAQREHNAVPFATIDLQLAGGPDRADPLQLVGNLLLLAPLGLYGPALFRGLRSLPAIVLLGAAVSITIELSQLGLSQLYGFPIRIADVDDVILNTAGVLIGYAIWRAWTWARPSDSERVARLSH